MKYCLFVLNFALFFGFLSLSASPFSSPQQGRILFLIQQGDYHQAIKLYQAQVATTHTHDYELLSQMGIALLSYGSRQTDPEVQLLTLFGAHVSANSDTYGIFEECLKSRYPQIQIVALGCLSHIQQDQADQAILHMLGSPYGFIRFEAIAYLCKKKHPAAIDQLESLMAKSPQSILALYPPYLADLGNAKSVRLLRKMFNHPSEQVRQAVILSVALHHRDDFLPQIRQQALHFNFAQQEVSAYALGLFRDEQSIEKLNKLSNSKYSETALAANWALYQLGHTSAIKAIEKNAFQGNLFAIHVLGDLNEQSDILLQLLQHTDLQVRINAQLALLKNHQKAALKNIDQLLIKDHRDLGFVAIKSPGKTFKAWKVVSGASEILKEDLEAYKAHLELKETLLAHIKELSEETFLNAASSIFTAQQGELLPVTVSLLEELESAAAIACLRKNQQKLGASLIRNYCNLALYRLGEPGPYADQLKQWIKKQSQTDLIQFRAYNPWESAQTSYDLTPAETSRLLIESFQAFAAQQDREGIELLIDMISTGNTKNKYALAGLLLRAAQ